jgi:hypothetical protein
MTPDTTITVRSPPSLAEPSLHAGRRIRCQFSICGWNICGRATQLHPSSITVDSFTTAQACFSFFHLLLSPGFTDYCHLPVLCTYYSLCNSCFGFSCGSQIDHHKFAAMTAVSCHASVPHPGTEKPSGRFACLCPFHDPTWRALRSTGHLNPRLDTKSH